jgi:tetratricopeptide (TPR) repeat protein
MTDVFAMQDEIAAAITNALKGKLGGDRASPRHYKPRLPAYEAFLRGRAHLAQFTPDAWNRAKGLFEQSIALDAEYGDPHAELALGYFTCGMHGILPMREVAPFVRAEVKRALDLNPSDPRPRFLSAAIALAHDYDWAAAETHFAASMNVADVSGHARWIYASLYLRGLGRFEESAAQMERAVQQDPLNATWHAIWGAHLFDAGRLDQSIDECLRATELEPNYHIAQHILGEAYWTSGKRSQAIAAFERSYKLAPWSIAAGWLAAALWLRDEKARATQIIVAMGDSPEPLWGRVVYHLLTSDLDAAAHWYGRMIDHRDPFALVYASAPVVEPLRGHPRWPELAARMKLSDPQLCSASDQ